MSALLLKSGQNFVDSRLKQAYSLPAKDVRLQHPTPSAVSRLPRLRTLTLAPVAEPFSLWRSAPHSHSVAPKFETPRLPRPLALEKL